MAHPVPLGDPLGLCRGWKRGAGGRGIKVPLRAPLPEPRGSRWEGAVGALPSHGGGKEQNCVSRTAASMGFFHLVPLLLFF